MKNLKKFAAENKEEIVQKLVEIPKTADNDYFVYISNDGKICRGDHSMHGQNYIYSFGGFVRSKSEAEKKVANAGNDVPYEFQSEIERKISNL